MCWNGIIDLVDSNARWRWCKRLRGQEIVSWLGQSVSGYLDVRWRLDVFRPRPKRFVFVLFCLLWSLAAWLWAYFEEDVGKGCRVDHVTYSPSCKCVRFGHGEEVDHMIWISRRYVLCSIIDKVFVCFITH